MLKGVLYGDKHTIKDWGIYLSERPEIEPPSPKTNYIDIPSSDGVLDITEAMTGEVNYNPRKIKCKYVVKKPRNTWTTLYSEILDYIQGRELRCILDEDPKYYYLGRFQVNEWESSKKTSNVVIEGYVQPYKMELYGSLEEWLWDPFNFETDMIRNYKGIPVDGEHTIIIDGNRKTVIPEIIVSSSDGSGMDLNLNGHNYHLDDGNNRILTLTLKYGENILKFTGNGEVSIDYKGGRL